MNEKIIQFKNVVKKYANNIAIDNMNFEVNRGEILGFLGPNGSGKTTSVRLMNGVIFPDSSSITVKGFDTIKNGLKSLKPFSIIQSCFFSTNQPPDLILNLREMLLTILKN